MRKRLRELSDRLGDADWHDGVQRRRPDDGFSAAKVETVITEFPKLATHIARAEARPDYKRAFPVQLAVNAGTATVA